MVTAAVAAAGGGTHLPTIQAPTQEHVKRKAMARTWQKDGKIMARTWQEHGNNMARAWQEHGNNMARAWQ